MTAVCDIHGTLRHQPTAQEDQFHHIVPRDWQQRYTPTVAPAPGVFSEFGVKQQLWDVRGVNVPPTCHLNVHHWIVAIMHQLAADVPAGPVVDQVAVDRAVATARKTAGVTARSATGKEIITAALAPTRFLEAGGDLRVLIAAKAWGAS